MDRVTNLSTYGKCWEHSKCTTNRQSHRHTDRTASTLTDRCSRQTQSEDWRDRQRKTSYLLWMGISTWSCQYPYARSTLLPHSQPSPTRGGACAWRGHRCSLTSKSAAWKASGGCGFGCVGGRSHPPWAEPLSLSLSAQEMAIDSRFLTFLSQFFKTLPFTIFLFYKGLKIKFPVTSFLCLSQ